MAGLYLPPLDPSLLNPHLTYLQVLLTFPVRSCEDPVAQQHLHPLLLKIKVFFTIELLDLEFYHKTSYLRHISFRQPLLLIPIVVTNRSLELDWESLYPKPPIDMHELELPFSKDEIKQAIFGVPPDK